MHAAYTGRNWLRGVLVLSAALWAGVLSFAGLVALVEPAVLPGPLRDVPGIVRVLIGLLGVASGQLVFSCLVADRLFPRASRAVVWGTEIAVCVVLFASFALLAMLLAGIYFGSGA